MVTMREVAARAGVSQKTVSRVFNDDPNVRAETRARVRAVMAEMHYSPNPLAISFRRGGMPVIGVVVPDIVDPFFARIVRAVEETARPHQMSALVANLGQDPGLEEGIVRTMMRQMPSALIICPTSDEHGYLAEWTDRIPIVFVDRPPRGIEADVITGEDELGAQEATGHLLGHGHRRIAFVGDRLTLPTTRHRLAGHRAALRAAGLAPDPELELLDVTDATSATAALRSLTTLAAPPTAIFSSNAQASMLLVGAGIAELGLGLVSFGDFPLADALRPSVTVMNQAPERMGTLAARRVVARLAAGPSSTRHLSVLGFGLIERESCAVGAPAG